MTSGNFSIVFVADIQVNREERQRKTLENIEDLAHSIRENGLINPVIVNRSDMMLVAGERRLEAHKMLGYQQIAVQYAEDLEPEQLHMIELEENIRRSELPWRDHVEAIAKYHEIKRGHEEGWTKSQTAEELNMSLHNLNRYLTVKGAIDEGVEQVIEAPKFSTAYSFAERRQERKKASTLREIGNEPLFAPSAETEPAADEPDSPAETSGPRRFAEIRCTDFFDFADTVWKKPFNFVHCDFPYGIKAGDTRGQSGAVSYGGYEDKPETFFELLDGFLAKQDNFVGPSAHLMFWFSMNFYEEVIQKLTEGGWRVNPFPLIWFRSDNSGILPDKDRGPRRVYETALFASRGDRKIVRAVGNCVASATTKEYHMSEKPTPVLEHFFRMIVDESTRMIDPTAGSGNAVKVAEQLGAEWSLGLEMSEEYAELAKENLLL